MNFNTAQFSGFSLRLVPLVSCLRSPYLLQIVSSPMALFTFPVQSYNPSGDLCVLWLTDQCYFFAMDISLTLCHLLKTLSHCTDVSLCHEAVVNGVGPFPCPLVVFIFSHLTVSGSPVGLTGDVSSSEGSRCCRWWGQPQAHVLEGLSRWAARLSLPTLVLRGRPHSCGAARVWLWAPSPITPQPCGKISQSGLSREKEPTGDVHRKKDVF